MRTISALPFLALLCDCVAAVHFPVIGSIQKRNLELDRRADVLGSAPLNNTDDIVYRTNISLGGVPFLVLIDTGR
jgi:hypothetical protein